MLAYMKTVKTGVACISAIIVFRGCFRLLIHVPNLRFLYWGLNGILPTHAPTPSALILSTSNDCFYSTPTCHSPSWPTKSCSIAGLSMSTYHRTTSQCRLLNRMDHSNFPSPKLRPQRSRRLVGHYWIPWTLSKALSMGQRLCWCGQCKQFVQKKKSEIGMTITDHDISHHIIS